MVSVVCGVIIIVGIVAVSIYFCCGRKNRRKHGRNPVPIAAESNASQSTQANQDEGPPHPLPKVSSSGLWMSKSIMQAQGPNDAYHQLKSNGIRKEPVMMREILSTPNVNQAPGYIYQGNIRMYHSQQIPNQQIPRIVSGYSEYPGAYYNEGFIYPAYADAGLSHRSSMRFLEASGYYAPEQIRSHEIRRAHDVSRRPSNRESFGARAPRINGDIRGAATRTPRYQQRSPQREKRKSRSIESEGQSGSSLKNKSVDSSAASGAESVVERPIVEEAAATVAASPVPVVDKADESIGRKTDKRSSHHDEDVRTQVDSKTKVETTATPSTSTQVEPDNMSLDKYNLSPTEQRDIPSDQQSVIESISDVTDLESKGQKITTQAFEFLDTYISDADDDIEKPKSYPGKS